MYVCVYVCLYIYIYAFAHAFAYVSISISISILYTHYAWSIIPEPPVLGYLLFYIADPNHRATYPE